MRARVENLPYRFAARTRSTRCYRNRRRPITGVRRLCVRDLGHVRDGGRRPSDKKKIIVPLKTIVVTRRRRRRGKTEGESVLREKKERFPKKPRRRCTLFRRKKAASKLSETFRIPKNLTAAKSYYDGQDR